MPFVGLLQQATFMDGVMLEEKDISARYRLLQKGFLFLNVVSGNISYAMTHGIGIWSTEGRRSATKTDRPAFIGDLRQHHGVGMSIDQPNRQSREDGACPARNFAALGHIENRNCPLAWIGKIFSFRKDAFSRSLGSVAHFQWLRIGPIGRIPEGGNQLAHHPGQYFRRNDRNADGSAAHP